MCRLYPLTPQGLHQCQNAGTGRLGQYGAGGHQGDGPGRRRGSVSPQWLATSAYSANRQLIVELFPTAHRRASRFPNRQLHRGDWWRHWRRSTPAMSLTRPTCSCLKRPPRATASGRTAEVHHERRTRAHVNAPSLSASPADPSSTSARPWAAPRSGSTSGGAATCEAGPEGLYDLTRANHHVAQRIPPELERTILSIRRRLQAHATPATRYSLIGAAAILAELKALGIRPLPSRAHHRARPASATA